MNYKSIVKICLLISVPIIMSSCKKNCYICQAKTRMTDRLVDFREECGTQIEKDSMEMKFRKDYENPDYYIFCK